MKRTFFSIFILILVQIVVIFSTVNAQYVKANVTVKLEKLHQDLRLDMQNFHAEVREYIETNEWSDDKSAFDEITVTITIVIDNVSSSFENVYSARFHIFSTTGFQEGDKEWRFPYRRNQIMLFDPNIFDSLTGLIDFYIYILIGEELDRYEQYGGEMYFNKALLIAQLGKSDRYNRWWEKRETYIRRYLAESHRPYRDMSSWFYAAHYWTLENDYDESELAAEETLKLLKIIAANTFEQEFKVNFFRRNYKNIALVFSPFENMYSEIIKIDPERKDFYENFIKR